MKSTIFVLLLILPVMGNPGFSQGKSRKELKEEKTLTKQKQIEALVNAREFVFVAKRALPTGMGTVDLFSNPNYVKFQPDFIDSYMPFFGTAYGGIGYGTDRGLKFKGKPVSFTIEKNKNGYQVDAVVKDENDNYRLSLFIGFEGSASLTITSDNRSAISYQGEISAPEKSNNR